MLRSRFCFVAISNEPKNKWIIEDGATLETTRIIGLSFLDAGRIPELYLRFLYAKKGAPCFVVSDYPMVRLCGQSLTTGSGILIRVGEQMICLTETGELIVFGAKPDQLKIDFTQQVSGPTRAHFAYSKGKLWLEITEEWSV